jgi:stage V sporulation protein B
MTLGAGRAVGEVAPVPGRGTAQILASRVILLVSGFGVSIILAREFGPAAFGIYGVVMSYLVWFERLVGGGIPRGTTTLLSRDPAQRAVIEQSTRLLLVLMTLPFFGLAWLLAPWLADRLGIPAGTGLIRIAALNLLAMALYFTYDSIFSGLRLFGLQSLLQILQSVAKVIGIVLLLFVGVTVTGAFVAHAVATLIAVIWASRRLRIGAARPSVAVMREILTLALPLGTYLVSLLVLMNLSLWQLQAASGHAPEGVGHYVAGLNLTRILMMVPSSVSGVLYASLVWAVAASRPDLARKYVQGAVRFAMILIVPACVLLVVDASPVMGLLFGPEYAEGGRILAMLCLAFAMVALLDVLFNALMASGGRALSAGVLLGLMPVLYALNLFWIPRAGAFGAAAASAVVLAVGAVISLGMTYRRLGAPVQLRTVLRVSAAGIMIGVIAMLVPLDGYLLVFKHAALGALYLAVLWLTREISAQDAKPLALWKTDAR